MENKKFWIFGCGGCLIVVVLLVIAIIVGSAMFLPKLQEMGSESSQKVFGSDPPGGYSVMFGMPMGEMEMVMLSNMVSQNILIALRRTTPDPEFDQLINSTDPESVVDVLEQQMSQSSSSSDMTIKGVEPLPLSGGTHTAYTIEMESSSGRVSPAVMSIIPYDDQTYTVLLLTEARGSGTTDEAYQTLLTELVTISNETAVTEGMIYKAPGETVSVEEHEASWTLPHSFNSMGLQTWFQPAA